MLVLGRKEDQKIRFPDLGITIEVLRIKNRNVSIGVDAPTEFRILRDEIADSSSDTKESRLQVFRLPAGLRHDIRNQLNKLSLGLALFRDEIQFGKLNEAATTFDHIMQSLQDVSTSQVFSRQGAVAERERAPTALLIEDQDNEREMLAGFLRLHGYQISTVANGREALDYLSENEQPDMALIDMEMPELDGAATVRRIRDIPSLDRLSIYGLSGQKIEETGLSFETDRVNGWFMKPLDPRSLVEMLASSGESARN